MTSSEENKVHLMMLADFMVQNIMEMSDEEILAETTPEEIAQARAAFDRALEEALFGGRPQKPRQTALRACGKGFETVELDDNGKIIEPVRCICGSSAIITDRIAPSPMARLRPGLGQSPASRTSSPRRSPCPISRS